VGELIQIDGSEHRWFEDRAPFCALLVFVDDATSALMKLRFFASESTLAYFEALKRYLAQHGKPIALYSDKHSIFQVSNEDATGGDGMTQFGRALSELNIEILCANPSQAKGRLERAHHSLQELPYSAFDKLQRVSHEAIIENKRLGEVLAWIKEQQDRRPHHRGDLVGPRRSSQKAGLMKDRADHLAQSAKPRSEPRLARRRCDIEVSAAGARLLQRPPGDISTLHSKRHLNSVATERHAGLRLSGSRMKGRGKFIRSGTSVHDPGTEVRASSPCSGSIHRSANFRPITREGRMKRQSKVVTSNSFPIDAQLQKILQPTSLRVNRYAIFVEA